MNSTPKNHAGDDFTAEMRDKQARGKDPYGDPEEERNIGGESFTSQEQRRLALQMLDDPEGLMAEAQRTGDSVPGVRWKYQHILSGIPQASGRSTSAKSSKNSKREHKER
ncbi:hypothetical protein PG994_003151 [Apiospora phragmitis]|uniref:Uncharacterized protein n=1 Tax=Apiospora phragmitis TaxID=2905665 RepID=A0ABR1W784_9PEZI